MPSERRYVDPASGEVVENPTIRPFSEVLAELGEGTTHAELSEAFWELLCRVQETGKAGTLTLVIGVGANGAGRVEIKDELKLKLPEFPRPPSHFFVDKHGNASRRDPNQPSLPGITHINREAN